MMIATLKKEVKDFFKSDILLVPLVTVILPIASYFWLQFVGNHATQIWQIIREIMTAAC